MWLKIQWGKTVQRTQSASYWSLYTKTYLLRKINNPILINLFYKYGYIFSSKLVHCWFFNASMDVHTLIIHTINVKNSRTIYFNGLQKHVFIAVNVLAILDHLVKSYIFFLKSCCQLRIMILHINIGRICKGPIPTLTHPNVT